MLMGYDIHRMGYHTSHAPSCKRLWRGLQTQNTERALQQVPWGCQLADEGVASEDSDWVPVVPPLMASVLSPCLDFPLLGPLWRTVAHFTKGPEKGLVGVW